MSTLQTGFDFDQKRFSIGEDVFCFFHFRFSRLSLSLLLKKLDKGSRVRIRESDKLVLERNFLEVNEEKYLSEERRL